jgi:hypothetical protein
MAVRLLVDGSRADVVNYYQNFPTEPTVKPDADLEVRLPIDQPDRIDPMSFIGLLTRMLALPPAEKQVLIICHGNTEGLAIPIVPGSKDHADQFNLHLLLIMGQALQQIEKIKKMPEDQQAGAWQQLLKSLKFFDGKDIFLDRPGETPATYQAMFEYALNKLGNRDVPIPPALLNDVQTISVPPASGPIKSSFKITFKNETTKDSFTSSATAKEIQAGLESLSTIGANNITVVGPQGGPWTCTFINARGGGPQPLIQVPGGNVTQKARLTAWPIPGIPSVNRQQLDELINKGNQLRGRFDRLDFRSCNTGKFPKTLEVVQAFFGCKQVCAPDVVAFVFNAGVGIDPDFDKDFDNKVDAATNNQLLAGGRAVAGRQPVRIDPTTNAEVTVPVRDMPKTRRFDTDKVRRGDEVFMRMWVVRVHPHQFLGWLRGISTAQIEQFAKDKIDPDISKWTNRGILPMVGLWLVNDFNVLSPSSPPLNPGPSTGDPLAGLDLGSPPPQSLPAFALPRDPEYRRHLICVP